MPDANKGSRPDPEALRHLSDQHPWGLYQVKKNFPEDSGLFRLKAYATDYDGAHYVCRLESFTTPAYEGEREISSLPVFPLRYAENAGQIRRDAHALGRKFIVFRPQTPTLQSSGRCEQGL